MPKGTPAPGPRDGSTRPRPAARAKGQVFGRRPGQRPKSDKLDPKVPKLVAEGRSYRWVAGELGINKNTVGATVARAQAEVGITASGQAM